MSSVEFVPRAGPMFPIQMQQHPLQQKLFTDAPSVTTAASLRPSPLSPHNPKTAPSSSMAPWYRHPTAATPVQSRARNSRKLNPAHSLFLAPLSQGRTKGLWARSPDELRSAMHALSDSSSTPSRPSGRMPRAPSEPIDDFLISQSPSLFSEFLQAAEPPTVPASLGPVYSHPRPAAAAAAAVAPAPAQTLATPAKSAAPYASFPSPMTPLPHSAPGNHPELSPASTAFFSRVFLEPAKTLPSFASIAELAASLLPALPPRMHAQLHAALADQARRMQNLPAARRHYRYALKLQPRNVKLWLDAVRLEDDAADPEQALTLLQRSLVFCPDSESLLLKTARALERLGSIAEARAVFARGLGLSPDKAAKIALEAALFEYRSGRLDLGRQGIARLASSAKPSGNLFSEALKAEDREDCFDEALRVATAGVAAFRCTAVWLQLLRLFERALVAARRLEIEAGAPAALCHAHEGAVDAFGPWMQSRDLHGRALLSAGSAGILVKLEAAGAEAAGSIAKELIWRVHCDLAQIHQRLGNSRRARQAMEAAAAAAAAHQPTVLWRVLVASARVELVAGDRSAAARLMTAAVAAAASKSRPMALIEQAGFAAYCGGIDESRSLLAAARKSHGGDWKVHFESIQSEIRAGAISAALKLCHDALTAAPSTGRLWALLVQLAAFVSFDVQWALLTAAVARAPKSGEVWVEATRLHLNPLSPRFSLAAAAAAAESAVYYTPQYGDSTLEALRCALLSAAPDALASVRRQTRATEPNYGQLWFFCTAGHTVMSVPAVFARAEVTIRADLTHHASLYREAISRPSAVAVQDARQLAHCSLPSLSLDHALAAVMDAVGRGLTVQTLDAAARARWRFASGLAVMQEEAIAVAGLSDARRLQWTLNPDTVA